MYKEPAAVPCPQCQSVNTELDTSAPESRPAYKCKQCGQYFWPHLAPAKKTG